jgi:predicted 3-demethylubiquinone-9 3-methyltransferase (glyoxalase superfamily)
MQKITPFLWFDNQSEEAVNFIPPFLKIQRSGALLDTEKKELRSQDNRKDR